MSVSHLAVLRNPLKNPWVDCVLIFCWFTDLDECQLQGVCPNGNCRNTVGSYRCMCKPGYIPDPTLTTCIRKSYNLTLSHHFLIDSHPNPEDNNSAVSDWAKTSYWQKWMHYICMLVSDMQICSYKSFPIWVWYFPSLYDRIHGKYTFHYFPLPPVQP